MGVDWTALRLEYVHGTASMQELADAHNLNPAGVMKRAAEEGWTAERQKLSEKVREKASAAITESRADQLIKFNAADVRIANGIKSKVARILNLDAVANKLTPKDLRALAGALDSAQKVGRLALGASTESATVSISGEVRIAQVSELDALSVDELRDLLRLTRKIGEARPLTIEMAE